MSTHEVKYKVHNEIIEYKNVARHVSHQYLTWLIPLYGLGFEEIFLKFIWVEGEVQKFIVDSTQDEQRIPNVTRPLVPFRF